MRKERGARGEQKRKGCGLEGRLPQCRDCVNGLAEYFCPDHAPITGEVTSGWDWGQSGPAVRQTELKLQHSPASVPYSDC